MTDDEVAKYVVVHFVVDDYELIELALRFIDRYIPGYIFFSAGVQAGYNPTPSATGESEPSTNPPWKGNGLRLVLDVNRELVKTEVF